MAKLSTGSATTATVNPLQARYKNRFSTLHAVRVPHPLRLIAWLLLMMFILVGVALYVTPWVQTTAGSGLVSALDPRDRQQEIHALVGGRIQEWYVRDGSAVQAGDRIVKIVDNDPLLLERLEAERAALTRKLESARIATQTAELDDQRRQALFDQGLVSRREREDARIRWESLKAQQAQAEADLQRVIVNLSRQFIQEVIAPRDGTILRLASGDKATVIQEGETLATFIPSDIQRVVEVYIDGRDIPLVQPGRKVRLQFEGWPAVQFSGWPSTAIGTFGGEVLVVDQSAQADGRFRVVVVEDPASDPWPDGHFIRLGAKVKAWVLLDTVRLGYELWRRLNNFPPNFNRRPEIASQSSVNKNRIGAGS